MTRQSFDYLFAGSNAEHLTFSTEGRFGCVIGGEPVCPSESSNYYRLIILTGSYNDILMDLVYRRLLNHMVRNVH